MKRFVPSLLLLAAIVFMHSPSAPVAAPTAEETTYQRVMRTGTIRCAYISWQPYSLKDPNHPEQAPTGSSVDIMERLAARLGLKVEWTEEIGWGTIGEGFVTKRYDAVCTQLWPDAPKLRAFQLGLPMFYSEIRPYAAKEMNASALKQADIRIAVIDGALSQTIAEEAFPQAALVRLPPAASSAEFYLTLTTGKADVILADADEVAAQTAAGLAALQPVHDAAPVRVLPHVFAFPGDDLRFSAMMNAGLQLLRDEGYFMDVQKLYGLAAEAAQR